MVDKQWINVDMHAVARAAKVSISTVSRSFNHPEKVNPATRKKIDRAVKRLGYIRSRAAQTMHGKRSATIGVVVPTIDHAIFGEVVQAFSDAVDKDGFTILMASHGFDLAREYTILRKFLEHRVDGIAIVGIDHAEETFQLIEEQGVPAVSMWNYDPESVLSCVGADNVQAGKMAAKHLIKLGHRRIATLFPEISQNDRARDRWNGANAALSMADIAVPEKWQSSLPYLISEAKLACLEILSSSDRPTAVLCGNDVIAQGAIYAAQKVGLQLPVDLSIVGIGDFKGSAEIEPALTTIRIPARTIGASAGQEVLRLIRSEETVPTRQRCDLRFLVRASTAALRPPKTVRE